MIEITSISIAGIKILEPVTTLTDLIVSGICLYAYINLKKHPVNKSTPIILYRYFFLTMSIATFLGGVIGHAFLYFFSFEWKLAGWTVSMFSVALAERAAISHAKPLLKKNIGNFWIILNIVELCVFLFFTLYTLKFIFVETHAVYGLLIVLFSFECYIYIRTKDKGSQKVLWAVLLMALAAATHIGKLTIHAWFNYLDLSHVFMAASAWILFKAVEDMKVYKK